MYLNNKLPYSVLLTACVRLEHIMYLNYSYTERPYSQYKVRLEHIMYLNYSYTERPYSQYKVRLEHIMYLNYAIISSSCASMQALD